jgi:hypothetical protein
VENNLANIARSFFVALLSTIIGLMITSLLLYLAIDHIATFWAFLVIVWVIISAISGFILNDKINSIISTAFTSGIFFVLVLVIVLIFSSLSTLLLEILNSSTIFGINEAGIIAQAFVSAIIVTLIIAGISISFSLFGFFISNQMTKSQKEYSTADYETQFFEQYESPTDAGRYHKKDDQDEI